MEVWRQIGTSVCVDVGRHGLVAREQRNMWHCIRGIASTLDTVQAFALKTPHVRREAVHFREGVVLMKGSY